MKLHTAILLPVCAAAFTAFAAFGADTKSSLDSNDEKFVKKAALMGKSEVQISELGAKKATSAEVKQIAEQMVADHSKANTELTAFAASKSVELTASDDTKAQDAIADLEQKSGADFDKAFLNQLEKDHKKTVDLFEEASKDAKDPALKAWVDKTLPTLKGHLDHVTKALEAK